MLSGGRITKETEDYLLHELPFARGQMYLHAIAVQNGCEMVWTNKESDVFTRVCDVWKALTSKNESKSQT